MATLSLLAGCPGAETHCFGTVSRPKCVLACLLACLLAGGRAGLPACLALPCLALPCQWLATLLAPSCQHPASATQGKGVVLGRSARGVPTAARWEQEQEVASARRGAGPTLPEAMRRESIRTGYAIGCWRSSWLRWAPRPSYPLDSGAARGRWEPPKGLPPPCRGGATRGSPGTATPDAPRLRGAAKAAAGERPMGGGASMGLQLVQGPLR